MPHRCLASLTILAGLAAAMPALADGELMTADQIAFRLSQSKGLGPARVNLPAVTFEFNSARLTPEAEKQLDELATALAYRSFAGLPFTIAGHTDAIGAETYNKSLSEQRAETVRVYLVQQHKIDVGRMATKGVGESRPLDDYPPDHGQQRRVEIELKR